MFDKNKVRINEISHLAAINKTTSRHFLDPRTDNRVSGLQWQDICRNETFGSF